ncbi:MAG: diacylglycerol kinase family protein [Bacteroidia bacterium]
MKKRKILFISNPISGGRSKSGLRDVIKKQLWKERFKGEITETERPGHATELAAGAVAAGFDSVVACGGDGTVNETAASLTGTDVKLGILPFGSGNGLARHLKIPLSIPQALQRINRYRSKRIDAAYANEHVFFNVSGVGFDAFVGDAFSKTKSRGFYSYARSVASSLRQYKPSRIEIQCPEGSFHDKAFIVSFANSSQYGNGACINPSGKINDGRIEICILEPFPIFQAPHIMGLIFKQKIFKSSYFKSFSVKEAVIKCGKDGFLHIDGEPYPATDEIRLRVEQKALRVIV